jgi:hypothetical protein
METQTFETGLALELFVGQIAGNLQVRGWDNSQVSIQANMDDLNVQQEADKLRVNCQGNCSLRVPEDASLRVEVVHGNAYFKNISNHIVIEESKGSLSLRSIHSAQLGSIHGELTCKDFTADLAANQVHGNASIRNIQGASRLEQVHGNLDLRQVEGEIEAQVRGNARLRLGLLMGDHYRIFADGNLNCQIPQDASLQLDLFSQNEKIKVYLPEGSQIFRQPQYQFTLGEGNVPMSLSCNGSLYLDARDATLDYSSVSQMDFSDALPDEISLQIASQVENQINTQMEQMTRQINEQISRLSEKVSKAGLSPEETEQIMEQALKASERETARTQEKMRRAQEKLERKLDTALERNRYKARFTDRRSQRGAHGSASQAASGAKDSVSAEEQLLILRMLEEKKITPEEADELLSALEGKS